MPNEHNFIYVNSNNKNEIKVKHIKIACIGERKMYPNFAEIMLGLKKRGPGGFNKSSAIPIF